MKAAEILAVFPRLSALVVGDICLDRWCTYNPATAEASYETGIPRIGVVATGITPGAGGTIAGNLAKLGVGRVSVRDANGAKKSMVRPRQQVVGITALVVVWA